MSIRCFEIIDPQNSEASGSSLPNKVKEECIALATIAEEAERYDEMAHFMKEAMMFGSELTEDERNLFCSVLKNTVKVRISSWKAVNDMYAKEKGGKHEKVIQSYLSKIQNEVINICYDTVSLIDNYLFPNSSSIENKVFYCKSKGDCFRWIAEVLDEKRITEIAHFIGDSYQMGKQLSIDLSSTNPIRLSLCLAIGLFYYDILKDEPRAFDFLRETFDNAIAMLDNVSETEYRGATMVLSLIRDYL
eukprot:TRINITY_DN6928_c0_g1_i4.p1 TRINITY_DN6928_c0_g1~~TRINITY_DN6928_c0_g1_i4.p1  ORF type:complete len:247 (-),score=31.82 TRINITY_DN6928_c0_g1_i4:608-1348(-)